jgi:hypothetical protein
VTSLAEARAEVRAARERKREGRTLAEEAEALSKDFRAFVVAAWDLVIPMPFVPGWHFDAMCEHVQAAYQREIYGLITTVPPGFLKSGIYSVFGPAWRWTHAPWERFLSASHGDDLATRDNRKCRMLMQTGWYQARWGGDWEFARDENLKTRYSNDRGGGRTISSSMTRTTRRRSTRRRCSRRRRTGGARRSPRDSMTT